MANKSATNSTEPAHNPKVAFLARRYTTLWTGELFSAILFPLLLLWYAGRDAGWANWAGRGYAVTLVSFILIQGVVWWRWKLRVLRTDQRSMPSRVLAGYRRLRGLNWVLIALYPAVLLMVWALTRRPPPTADVWLGLLFLGEAVLEQINYYYVQLMYDNPYDWAELRRHLRLRTGSIAKALSRPRSI
jgi:hypothetical protein